ncbi:biotin/lipoyl-containing protein [Micropruina sonneratiae]|uniref:biotin/lipoyl-containing protein n=1 Tax=Micropruina sonneratiae TaxID=2986940 RepID=UPI00222600F3|nr:biotin/lipoyl-containing protein [Micropruina sp. KQZ13P-5]MCW3158967.1 biotin/lipoyl-binding protein [Micropruina sp. KQZ13P-5]
MKLKVTVNGVAYDVEVEVEEQERPSLGAVVIGGGGAAHAPTTASVKAASANSVVAPLSGVVARILVAEGDAITEGQVLLVLEAMKMETEITAPSSGKVGSILVGERDSVQGGEPLIELA